MNDETPFTTIGDEPVEARIVAWVLGEASAFEVAELERLCEERPELMIFKRRMAALHGLVTEAEKPRFNHAWKLSAGKRRPLDELFGEEQPVRVDVEKEKRIRHSGRRAFLAIAACLIFTVVVAGLMSPMVLKQSRKADVAEARSMARQRELAAMEEQEMSEGMKALSTELPPERIEGTPRPIILPGQTTSKERAQRDASAAGQRVEKAPMMMAKKVQPDSASKPSSPTSSMTKAITANTASPTAIPTPDVDVPAESVDFGDGRDFGGGWGGGEGGRLAERAARPRIVPDSAAADAPSPSAKTPVPAELGAESSLALRDTDDFKGGQGSGSGGGFSNAPAGGERSNYGTIMPGSVSILADAKDGGLKNDLAVIEENKKPADEYWDTSKAQKGGFSYELHTGYTSEYAFRGRDLNDSPAARTNPALTNEHKQNVDEVRQNLYQAEGNYNLGKYDDATREYEDVLRKDPYNKAARKGMERIASTKSDYYRAAYDHTRAELLSNVEMAAGEKEIPAKSEGNDLVQSESTEVVLNEVLKDKELEGFTNFGTPIMGKDDERAELLAQVDKAWELSVPTEKVAMDKSVKAKKIAKPEPPKVDLAKLMEEIAAAEDPYSTFSLNISDASFQIAQAALAKGERPDPAGIKVEQFYNAVNYGDPAPAAGQPVSCVIEQAAHPVIPGRNLVRVALKTAAAGRSAAQPLRLTLLVDQSGSMSRADRREAMDTAMRSLGTLLTDKDLVTVIGFSRTSRLLAVDMKGNEVGRKLADIVNQSASEGGTNLEGAIKLAEEKAMRQKLVGAQNRIVLFTDGAANLGDADPQRLAAKVEQLRQQGIAFDIAGIAADDLNDELLAELARKGNGRYSVVGKGENENFAKQLAGAFRPAAENVKVQVRFNPERVASYKLIGFEKDRLKTEDFRNDKVDAAELAAEEAGVAIYQVEPSPEGRGEIGEVSVRFRDTASGEMIERMWTMTHNASAPAIDQAAPSMQLATLSMLAGEKLKGGPLADAIDFKNFAQAQASVKQAFGQDTRVSEMLRMVDALK